MLPTGLPNGTSSARVSSADHSIVSPVRPRALKGWPGRASSIATSAASTAARARRMSSATTRRSLFGGEQRQLRVRRRWHLRRAGKPVLSERGDKAVERRRRRGGERLPGLFGDGALSAERLLAVAAGRVRQRRRLAHVEERVEAGSHHRGECLARGEIRTLVGVARVCSSAAALASHGLRVGAARHGVTPDRGLPRCRPSGPGRSQPGR